MFSEFTYLSTCFTLCCILTTLKIMNCSRKAWCWEAEIRDTSLFFSERWKWSWILNSGISWILYYDHTESSILLITKCTGGSWQVPFESFSWSGKIESSSEARRYTGWISKFSWSIAVSKQDSLIFHLFSIIMMMMIGCCSWGYNTRNEGEKSEISNLFFP